MKVLIIEDEERAARQLQKLLEDVGFSFELLGVFDTVVEATSWFKSQPTPDLVFMDIQLADGISFEIFENIHVTAPIIFTTAFDAYAIQAFQVNSIDYLLKPIKRENLERALEKFTNTTSPALSQRQLHELFKSFQEPIKRKGILAKDGKGFTQITIQELLYAYSEDSVTFGVTAKKRFIIDESIDELYQTLDSNDFFRINRGQIIARRAIEKIHPYFNHRLLLTISQAKGREFIVSRPKTTAFKNWLNS